MITLNRNPFDEASLRHDYVAPDGLKFDQTLLHRWNEAKCFGAFQYELNLVYKVVPGSYGLTAQLNKERALLRRAPHPFQSMDEPFNHERFNFTKVQDNEILLNLGIVLGRAVGTPRDLIQRSAIIVNKSPIETGHSLLVPFIDECLPQRVTYNSCKLVVQTMLMSSNRHFFIAYSSLLGLASVNHLHFHLYYWPYGSPLIVQYASHISDSLYRLDNWLTHGFVLQLRDKKINQFSRKIVSLIDFLHERKIPHNLIMARAPSLSGLCKQYETESVRGTVKRQETRLYVTAYIFPRKPVLGARPTTTFSVGACECAGQLTVSNLEQFENIRESQVKQAFQEETSLGDVEFEKLCNELQQ